MTHARRATATALAVAVLGVPVTLGLAVALAPAAEASTYRYWSYWWGERPGKPAAWQYASQGPATHSVGDTWVLGWRFATAPENGASAPRQSASFAALCPGLDTPVSGSVRVALVVDYGSSADAPPGQSPPTTSTVRVECLTLPTSPRVTGSSVLAAAGVPVRSEGGLVCALDGYPKGECAPLVTAPAPSPSRTATSPRPSATASAPAQPSAKPTRTATAPASAAPTTRTTPPGTGATSATTGASAAASGQPSSSPSTGVGVATPSADPTSPETDPTAGTGEASGEVPGPDTVVTPEETLPAASGSPVEADTGSPAAFALGALAVAAVAGGAWVASRRGGGA
jgi:hypothetical protein